MGLRYVRKASPLFAILAAALVVVALACGGDEPTSTPAPTATTPPTATPEPEATEAMMPEATVAPDATAVPGATATAAPTATPVEEASIDPAENWVEYLLNHRGYKPEWGEPQYGGVIKMSGPRPVSRWLGGYMGWGAFASGFGGFQAQNSLLMMDPWGIHQGRAHL